MLHLVGVTYGTINLMQYRKDKLECGQYYHIFSRSIAGYVIYHGGHDYNRMLDLLNWYRFKNFSYKCSNFYRLSPESRNDILEKYLNEEEQLVEIIAWCLMPTHIHLILKQLLDNGISKYAARVLNGYARYYNTKHSRQGPLFAGRFKNVLVENDNQLLHLTRYIHLNPSSANLVKNPEDWQFSSYPEYLSDTPGSTSICKKTDLFDFSPSTYKQFVNDRKGYQQKLSLIKSLLIEDYTG